MATYSLLKTTGASGTPSGSMMEREIVAQSDNAGSRYDALCAFGEVVGEEFWEADDATIPMDDGWMVPVESTAKDGPYYLHWTREA